MAKNTKEEKQKDAKKALFIRTTIFLFVALAFCCCFLFQTQIENLVNYNLNKNALSTEIDENGLKVHFIDVDQGDCTLIETPSGEKILVDTGDVSSKSQEKVQAYLSTITYTYEKGEPVIDHLILTHPDSDHIGGATYIFENYLVKNCYLPAIYYYDKASGSTVYDVPEGAPTISNNNYKEVLLHIKTEVDNFGCTKIFTSEFVEISSEESSWEIEFFAPIVGNQYFTTPSNPKTNNYSPILILSYMGKKIMLTGDAESKVEKQFVEKVNNGEYDQTTDYFDVDILKAGHHGSKTSSSAEFLEVVKPEYVIVSAGLNNSFGHPSDEAIQRLVESGVNEKCIYRTDTNGNILVGISNDGKLALVANHVQYVVYEIKAWQIIVIGIGASAIIIYLPYIAKIAKKGGKRKK